MAEQTKGNAGPNAHDPANNNVIIPTMPWTGFNTCLELIFDRLTVTDLTNVADAHPDFIPAAQSIYQRKFSHLELAILDGGRYVTIRNTWYLLPVTLASIMKHFGHLVLRLKIDYSSALNKYSHHWREAERIIIEHCTDSLTEIKLIYSRNFQGKVFEEIRKPFEKVTRAVICTFEDGMSQEFQKWFPNAFEPREATLENLNNGSATCNAAAAKPESVDAKDEVKLTDLNEYCLEVIFTHLNATDLTNIADAHKHFVSTAQLIYKRKYSERQLNVFECGHILQIEGEGDLSVTMTSLMKHFGRLVLNLKVDYGWFVRCAFSIPWENAHWRQAERLIFDHCTDTLKHIRFTDCITNKMMEEICKPFKSVEEVCLHNCDTVHHVCDGFEMHKVFPQVRCLQLGLALIHTIAPFRHLKEFHLLYDDQVASYSPYQFIDFLEKNSHIEKLIIDEICFIWNYDFLQFFNRTLPSLEVLHVGVPLTGNSSVHFKNVTSFTMHMHHDSVNPGEILLKFDNLKELKIFGHRIEGNGWINFILQNRALVQLEVQAYDVFYMTNKYSAEQLFQMVSSLPELKTFHISAVFVDAEERELLLQKCKRLGQLKDIRVDYKGKRSWQ